MAEIMQSEDAISSIMETFCEARSPLSASTSNSNRGPYTSYVLNVGDRGLYIDQLIPNSGNYLIQPGQEIELLTNHRGISYVFKSKHISREVDDTGFPFHHISLPTHVTYTEKRSEYRVPIKRDEHPTFHISEASGNSYPATLENISSSGARLRLAGQQPRLETNSFVVCEFDLVERGSLSCQALVKHQNPLSKTQETLVGIEFWQIPDNAVRELQKVLMIQQRRNIRAYLPS